MRYMAIIETDDFEDFEFFEDGIGKYMVGKDAGAAAIGGWIPLYFKECEKEPDKIRTDTSSADGPEKILCMTYTIRLISCRQMTKLTES